MRDRQHYLDMLADNPNATIGFTLAAKMVAAAHDGDDEDVRNIARRLKREYGEVMTREQVRGEMDR